MHCDYIRDSSLVALLFSRQSAPCLHCVHDLACIRLVKSIYIQFNRQQTWYER
ncbi:hypothetical protein BJV78DRAFT_1194320 [Lactifluus subvellereus]|nr:hypothetical protein BJV78DRAFT_1194320 [Lactifluus subvellereus]